MILETLPISLPFEVVLYLIGITGIAFLVGITLRVLFSDFFNEKKSEVKD